MKTFGKRLEEWIDAAGINQAELARRVNKSANYISNLVRDFSPTAKNGKPQPSKELVDAIARALGQPQDEVRLAAGYAPQQKQKQADELKAVIEEDEQMAVLFSGYSTMTKKQRAEMKPILEMVAREMDRLIAEEEAEAKKKPKDKGK